MSEEFLPLAGWNNVHMPSQTGSDCDGAYFSKDMAAIVSERTLTWRPAVTSWPVTEHEAVTVYGWLDPGQGMR